MTLTELIDLMVSRRVLRAAVEGMHVELDPSAFRSPGLPAKTAEATEDICPCGHDAFIFHDPAGLCLQGCSETLCQSKQSNPEL